MSEGHKLPDFSTFREMLEHLETGGAAYRYGSSYPIYLKGPMGHIESRITGGSAGELIHGAFERGVSFTVEEQRSTNWVLVSKAAWDAREEALRLNWERIMEDNRKRQEETGVYEGRVGQIVPRPQTLWQRCRSAFAKVAGAA